MQLPFTHRCAAPNADTQAPSLVPGWQAPLAQQPDAHEKNKSLYYFRMLDPDFTPRPVYNAIKDYAAK